MSGDGGVGGSIGTDITSGQCSEQCICDSLNTGLTAIVTALTEVDTTLSDKLEFNCSKISECQSEITAMLAELLAPIDADLADIQAALQFQIESLTDQGGQIGQLQAEVDSLASQVVVTTPPPTPPPKRELYGWCDFAGGEALVTDSPTPPGDTFVVVARGDEEDAVLAEATNTCKTYSTVSVEQAEPPPLFRPAGTYGQSCDVVSYGNTAIRQQIIGRSQGIFNIAGWVEEIGGISKFGFEGINLGNIGQVLAGAFNTQFNGPPLIAKQVVPALAASIGCNTDEMRHGLNAIAALGLVEHETGIDFSPWATGLEYALNAACPRKFIKPEDATDGYLANIVTEQELGSYYAIEGFCFGQSGIHVQTRKARPDPEQIVEMRHRNVINDVEYARLFRQIGYIDDEVPGQIFSISLHVPDIASVNRMLSSGSLSDQLSTRYTLTDDEDLVTQGQAKEWLESSGITDKEATAAWRAHWQTPQLGTLFELYQRLRDDKQFGDEGQWAETLNDAFASLNIPPFWRDRIGSILLTPLLQREIRLAYTSGAMKDDDLKPALRKTGHNDDAVDTIITELKPLRRHAILNHIAIRNWTEQIIDGNVCRGQLAADGFDADTITTAMHDSEHNFARSTWAECFARGNMPRDNLDQQLTQWGVSGDGAAAIARKLAFRIVDHQSVRSYTAGTVSRSDATQAMQTDGMDSAVINKLLDDADKQRANYFAQECARGIRSRQVMGELDTQEAQSALTQGGMSGEFAASAVQSYDCARKAEGKEIAVEKLCTWLYVGIIDQGEMQRRLIKMGYSEENATLITVDCVRANTLKAAKEQQRIANELQRTLDKEQRAVDKLNASNIRSAERLAKMRKQKADLRARRDSQLVSAIEKIYTTTEGDLENATAVVKGTLDAITAQYQLGVDDALRIVILASEKMKGRPRADYQQFALTLASAAASDGLQPSDADIAFVPRQNGSTHPSE